MTHIWLIKTIHKWLSVQLHIHIYIYIHIYICICIYVYICIYICMHMYICIYLYIYLYVHVYMRKKTCIQILMYTYQNMHTYTYVYIDNISVSRHMYIHIWDALMTNRYNCVKLHVAYKSSVPSWPGCQCMKWCRDREREREICSLCIHIHMYT